MPAYAMHQASGTSVSAELISSGSRAESQTNVMEVAIARHSRCGCIGTCILGWENIAEGYNDHHDLQLDECLPEQGLVLMDIHHKWHFGACAAKWST